MKNLRINKKRLIDRINTLSQIGRNEDKELTRLALSDEDKKGRDQLKAWFEELDLKFELDQFGNMSGTFQTKENKNEKPLMLSSHIDSVIDASIYDGVLGVVGALEVIQTIKEEG